MTLKVTAFGKTKTVKEWIDDPLCNIENKSTLYKRLKTMSPERAITCKKEEPLQLSFNGKTQTLRDWSKDPDCEVSLATLKERTYIQDLPIKEAMRYKTIYFTYQGKRKTLTEWSRSKECKVNYKTLHHRINTLNWDFEKALTTPPLRPGPNNVHR